MGQKSRVVGNGNTPASLERRRKDKTVVALDGLVADLARRTQSPIDGCNPTQHLESIRAIHRLLGQIQKLERPFVAQPNAPDVAARLQILKEWLQLQGLEMAGLRLEGGLSEGAGVVAEQPFKEGQLLCTVPAHVMMTTATAIRSKDDVGVLFKADPILRQMPTLILALHLLFEKHRPEEDPSNWAGYIASLPGQVFTNDSTSSGNENFVMPLGFSSETIEALKGTAVLVEMHKAVRNYARQYAHVRMLIKQLKGQAPAIDRANTWFTWAEFRWAASIVMTRQNPIPGTPDMEMGQALALIPFLDMFNHEEGDITCHFAIQHQRMELTAKRNFEPGQQVYISYGHRPSSALLLYSGFVPDHNSKDRIKVPVELPTADPLYSKKAALLKWLELPSTGWLELFHDGSPSPELATWVRVAVMQDLSVVMENLRAAIASRAQETAAILQYKAALREAEEKARAIMHEENETAEEKSSSPLASKVATSEDSVDQESSRDLKMEGSSGLHKNSSNGIEEIVADSERGADPLELQAEADAGEEQPANDNTELLNQGNLTQSDTKVDDDSKMKVNNGGLLKPEKLPQKQESILGEHLFPVEAAFLSEICRQRINDFGTDFPKDLNDPVPLVPQGLGLGLPGGPKSVQQKTVPKDLSRNVSKELSMAIKVRRQEQLTLLKAVDRSIKLQHVHSKDCQHC